MFVRVLVLVAVVNRALLVPLLIPFAVMAVVVAAFAAWLYYRDGSTDKGASAKGEVAVKNPFSLTAAAKFAALFAVVLLAVKIVQQTMPPSGLYAVAALSGLVDVDAITLSMAELAKTGEAQVAVVAIVIAALSNTLVKCGHGVCDRRPGVRQTAARCHDRDACRRPRHGFPCCSNEPWSVHIAPLA